MAAVSPKKRIDRGSRGSRHDRPTNAIKPGQVLNPFGAPRKGQSYSEIIRNINNLTGGEVVELIRKTGGSAELENVFSRIPANLPVKYAKMLRIAAATLSEPSPGLVTFEADREEGKVTDKLEATIHESPVEILKKIDAANAARANKG